ncbi:hypothetical protein BHM03_00028935 [Ensete ventricosum]|nr:hypothetical protein BHM03_00028935 [Ensete ventricosum]
MRHPSALIEFEQIMSATDGKQIVIFLDYDGTLSPIVDDPDSAFMSDAMRAAVKEVARCFPTAIVSGRCRSKVYDFVRLTELYYAGSHGMDIKVPKRYTKKVHRALLEKTKSIPGAKVENNKFCVSVHFRCVDEKVSSEINMCMNIVQRWSGLVEQVWSVLEEYPKLRITQGRKVRPRPLVSISIFMLRLV